MELSTAIFRIRTLRDIRNVLTILNFGNGLKDVLKITLFWCLNRLRLKTGVQFGRSLLKEVPGSEKKIPADLVLIAAGFLGSEKYVADAFGVKQNDRTNVQTKPGRYETGTPRVFACGDMRKGQSLVVWAIREGREAAVEVDESLMGYSYMAVQ